MRGRSRLPRAFVWLGAATAGLELCSGELSRRQKPRDESGLGWYPAPRLSPPLIPLNAGLPAEPNLVRA